MNTTAFDKEISAARRVYPVPEAIVKATIMAESGFDPNAVRGEPQIGDASYGLMQVLFSTAKRLGYPSTSPAEGLLNPAVNVHYGVKLLAENFTQAGNWPDAISAYNGGFRPDIGYGRKATRTVRIIAARDAQGNPTAYKTVTAGQYANQEYVDRVIGYLRQFAPQAAPGLLAASVLPGSPVALLLLVLGGLVYLLARRFGA